MTEHSETSGRLRVSALKANREHPFDIRPGDADLARLAEDLDLLDLRKLRFQGTLAPEAGADWRLDASLGATVVQRCVVSLQPVTTRIEAPVVRRFLKHMPDHAPQTDEVEMPEDETIEPLGEVIDLNAVLHEALALALPPYPKRDDAALEQTDFTAPGATPLSDADVKPFAGLADLKRKLESGDDPDR